MSTDRKPEDQITEAGAVELDESQLDDAAGGLLPAVRATEAKTDTSPSAATFNIQPAWPSKYQG